MQRLSESEGARAEKARWPRRLAHRLTMACWILAWVSIANAVLMAGVLSGALFLLPSNESRAWFAVWLGAGSWWNIGLPGVALIAGVGGLVSDRGVPVGIRVGWRGLALAVGSGCLTMALSGVLVLGARAVFDARQFACLQNVTTLSRALGMYAADNEGSLPLAENWADSIGVYVPSRDVWLCPDNPDRSCSYAYNSALSGLRYSVIGNGASVVAIFESDQGSDVAGGAELLPSEPRHLGCDCYGFADGHGLRLYREQTRSGRQVQWQPVLKGPAQEAKPAELDAAVRSP